MKKPEKTINAVVISITIVLLNIMKVIKVQGDIPFNISLADIIFPIAIFLIFISFRHWGFNNTFKYWYLYVALVMWITLTNFMAIYVMGINNKGLTGYAGELLKILICIGYLYIGYNTLMYINVRWLFRLLTIGAVAFFTYGLTANYLAANNLFPEFINYKYKLFFLGTYTDPNHAATYCTLTFFIMLVAIKYDSNRLFKVFYSIVVVLCAVGLSSTDSRGGLIGFVIAIIIFFLLIIRNNKQLLISSILMLILLVLGAFIADSYLTGGSLIAKLFASFEHFSRGLTIRLGLAKAAFLMGNDNPIFGVGRGNYIVNSKQYFELMGEKFINNIPHNTYLGLYAEVGIIGFILYSTPVIIILTSIINVFKHSKDWVRRNNWFLMCLVAGLFGLAVQASVLNVENRRTLWFLAGVVIYIIQHKIIDSNEDKKTIKKHSFWRINIIMSILVIFAYVYSMFNVYSKVNPIKVTGDYKYVLPVSNEETGTKFTLEYYIDVRQNKLEGNTARLNIIEQYNDKEVIIKGYTYSQARGNAKLSFVKHCKDSKIYIEVHKLNKKLKKYYVLPKKIYNKNKILYLDRNYYLTPKILSAILADKRYKSYVENIKEPSIEEVKKYNFDSKIRLEEVNVTEDEGKKYIEFTFYCIEPLKQDYVFWLQGTPDNIHDIPEKWMRYNQDYYGQKLIIPTSKWIQGQKYTHKYEFPRNKGWYNLRCGFYTKIDGKVKRLFIDKEGKNYVANLGWFNAKIKK